MSDHSSMHHYYTIRELVIDGIVIVAAISLLYIGVYWS